VKVIRFEAGGCGGTPEEVNYLEHVEVITTIRYSRRGALAINLTSPQGKNNLIRNYSLINSHSLEFDLDLKFPRNESPSFNSKKE